MSETAKDAVYTVKSVCKLLGIRESTLRAWETRYSAIEPQRLANNRRLYTSAEVEKLHLLIRAKERGHSIARISSYDISKLQALLESLDSPLPDANEEATQSKNVFRNPASFAKRILTALDDYDLLRVQTELTKARRKVDLPTFLLEGLTPLFAAFNQQVELGKLSVAKEHALSAILKSMMLNEFFSLNQVVANNFRQKKGTLKTVCVSTLDGDYHEFGILMAALLCINKGFYVHYLGASIPALPLAKAVHGLRADAVILGTPKVANERLVTSPDVFLKELAENLPSSCEIWLGGDNAGNYVPLNIAQKVRSHLSLAALWKYLQTF